MGRASPERSAGDVGVVQDKFHDHGSQSARAGRHQKKADYKVLADKYLHGRCLVLHTDSASAYKLKVPGVLHDSVGHSKKRVKVNGKWIWTRPCFTKLATHKLPNGKKLRTKAGTQIIDRAWRFIRSNLVGHTKKVGSLALRRAVRSTQWLYWNRGRDLWKATGEMLTELQ